MTDGRFDDFLDAASYADDVQARLRTARSDKWVSEELLQRLIAIGRVYRLHVLTVLADRPLHEPVSLNPQQALNLIDEIEFLRLLLERDDAIQGLMSVVLPLVVEAARSGDRNALVIEGP